MTQNKALKRAVRARMAETGENYTRALAAVQAERAHQQDGNPARSTGQPATEGTGTP